MKNYTATIQHDNGRFKLTLSSSNKQQAKQSIMDAEGCPESAILNVRAKKATHRKSSSI